MWCAKGISHMYTLPIFFFHSSTNTIEVNERTEKANRRETRRAHNSLAIFIVYRYFFGLFSSRWIVIGANMNAVAVLVADRIRTHTISQARACVVAECAMENGKHKIGTSICIFRIGIICVCERAAPRKLNRTIRWLSKRSSWIPAKCKYCSFLLSITLNATMMSEWIAEYWTHLLVSLEYQSLFDYVMHDSGCNLQLAAIKMSCNKFRSFFFCVVNIDIIACIEWCRTSSEVKQIGIVFLWIWINSNFTTNASINIYSKLACDPRLRSVRSADVFCFPLIFFFTSPLFCLLNHFLR